MNQSTNRQPRPGVRERWAESGDPKEKTEENFAVFAAAFSPLTLTQKKILISKLAPAFSHRKKYYLDFRFINFQ